MCENKTNITETPSIKMLEERLVKVERILSQLANEVKEPKNEMKYLDVASAAKILGIK